MKKKIARSNIEYWAHCLISYDYEWLFVIKSDGEMEVCQEQKYSDYFNSGKKKQDYGIVSMTRCGMKGITQWDAELVITSLLDSSGIEYELVF